jgi:hypothetical protein
MVFHVPNRGVGRLFDDDDDYAAFERVLTEPLLGDWPLSRPRTW